MKIRLPVFAALASISTAAMSYPSMRTESPGSALLIYMSNSEDRAYNCTLNFSWAYDSFGETKTGNESVNVNVGAKQGEFQAYRFAGSYVHLHFTDGPSISCNPS
jgi:hypothetical protein